MGLWALMFALLFPVFADDVSTMSRTWESIPVPIHAKNQRVYGTYQSGCILGAIEIPISNLYWEAVNTSRNRHYGHQQLFDFLTRLGKFAQQKKYGKLILGDSGLPAGGKLAYGHASHNLGIEMDVRFQFFNGGKMSHRQRNQWPEVDIAEQIEQPVHADLPVPRFLQSYIIERNFKPEYMELVRFSAEDEMVNRIFVNPAIKERLCRMYFKSVEGYPDWLLKVRPYYEHTAHFHVRMECPQDSSECVSQGEPTKDPTDPTGVGCDGDSLLWWLSRIEHKPVNPLPPPPPQRPMPATCSKALAKQLIIKIAGQKVCLGQQVRGNGTDGKITVLRCRDYGQDKTFDTWSPCLPQAIERTPRTCLKNSPNM